MIADLAEEHAADWPHQITRRENAERVDESRDRIVGGEKLRADVRREIAEDREVVPLQQIADTTGERRARSHFLHCLLSGGIEDVERRELRFRAQAIPEIDREAGIAGPQRVSPLPVAHGVLLRLRNAVHGERTRAFEPQHVLCPLIELQKRIAIAAGAVAQVRTFVQRPGRPDGLSRGEQQVIERCARQSRKTDDESGRAMAELEEPLVGVARAVEVGAPVGMSAGTFRGTPHSVDDATLPRLPSTGIEEAPAANQRQSRGDETVYGTKIGELPTAEALRP